MNGPIACTPVPPHGQSLSSSGPPSPGGPSLDPQETSCLQPTPQGFRAWRLAKIDPSYVANCERLMVRAYSQYGPQWNRYENCRTSAWFNIHRSTGEIRVSTLTCKQRLCPLCSTAKRNRIAKACHNWFKQCSSTKFLTLTLRSSTNPLPDQIERIKRSFRYLRRRALWKRGVRGGVWFCQLTLNPETDLWHPHLHIIMDSDFLPQNWIAKQWKKITTDSTITDIRQVRDFRSCASYAARYSALPVNPSAIPDDHAAEVAHTFESARTFGTFGSAHASKLFSKPAIDSADWYRLGTWNDVTAAIPLGGVAAEIWAAWHLRQRLPAEPCTLETLLWIESQEKPRPP